MSAIIQNQKKQTILYEETIKMETLPTATRGENTTYQFMGCTADVSGGDLRGRTPGGGLRC